RQAPNAVVQGSSAVQTKATPVKAVETCNGREGWALPTGIRGAICWEVREDCTEEDANGIEDVLGNSYPWGDSVAGGSELEVMTRWGEKTKREHWFKNKA